MSVPASTLHSEMCFSLFPFVLPHSNVVTLVAQTTHVSSCFPQPVLHVLRELSSPRWIGLPGRSFARLRAYLEDVVAPSGNLDIVWTEKGLARLVSEDAVLHWKALSFHMACYLVLPHGLEQSSRATCQADWRARTVLFQLRATSHTLYPLHVPLYYATPSLRHLIFGLNNRC